MPANTPLAFATSIRLTHNLVLSLRELDWSVFSFVTTIQLTDGFDTRGSFLVCDLTCLKTLIVGDGCFSAPVRTAGWFCGLCRNSPLSPSGRSPSPSSPGAR